MPRFFVRILIISLAIFVMCGCSSFQTTKNVWKGAKSLWGTYVSPPANVDYDEKGDLSPAALALSNAMIGVDLELGKLERVMQNADKPPTMEWLENLFRSFPWINGFAGVKYDGTILGQEPPDSLKELDFNYLLYEDKKQRSRALRADVQPSPLGPEVMLATPLYDGIDFLGIVVAYFDMRSLMAFSDHAQDIVVLCPTALLWPGKYDFASTPLAGVDWSKVVRESAAGTCSNSQGSFYYLVRYLGNLPLVFAVPEKGDFQPGSGSVEQGFAYFPQEREKGSPPPVSEERKQRESAQQPMFARNDEAEGAPEMEGAQESAQAERPPISGEGEIQPGSRESVLLRGKGASGGRQIQERALEGENVPVERVQRQRRRPAPMPEPGPILLPEEGTAEPEFKRPSPFGPRKEEKEPEFKRPSPFGPRESTPASPEEAGSARQAAPEAPAAAETPAIESSEPPASPNPSETGSAGVEESVEKTAPAPAAQPESTPDQPPLLPGGRPSPFGPRN